jgi:hypothetical protein
MKVELRTETEEVIISLKFDEASRVAAICFIADATIGPNHKDVPFFKTLYAKIDELGTTIQRGDSK